MQEELEILILALAYAVDPLEVEGVKHKVNKRQVMILEEIEGGCEDETL